MRGSTSTRQAARPYVLVNMAMTADGKIATANRKVTSFGSRRDHDHLLELRSTVDAVMCGARTASTPGVSMGPGPARFRRRRQARGLAEFNLRVIVTGSGGMRPDADVFRHQFSPILLLTTKSARKQNLKKLRPMVTAVKAFGDKDINLAAALRWLREEWGVHRLMCEGGAALNDAMFRAGLVDELHLTVCPRIFGGRDAPTIADGSGLRMLGRAAQLTLVSIRRVQDELYLRFVRAKPRVAG